MLLEVFCWYVLDLLVCLEGRVTSNQYKVIQIDHLYDETFLVSLNHILWPLQSPGLNTVELMGDFIQTC